MEDIIREMRVIASRSWPQLLSFGKLCIFTKLTYRGDGAYWESECVGSIE